MWILALIVVLASLMLLAFVVRDWIDEAARHRDRGRATRGAPHGGHT